jgi:microcompartment protein CcmK/EutM
MKIGLVTGSVVAVQKDDSLKPFKLLIVHQVDAELKRTYRDEVAADPFFGAGIGDTVLLTQGSPARAIVNDQHAPVDLVVCGIVDSIETKDGSKYVTRQDE